jgi:hypothetical protein
MSTMGRELVERLSSNREMVFDGCTGWVFDGKDSALWLRKRLFTNNRVHMGCPSVSVATNDEEGVQNQTKTRRGQLGQIWQLAVDPVW